MNVLSLFDGMSCAKVALDRLGVEHTYYASEVDKYAIQVSNNNHTDIVQLGDARQLAGGLPKIDLLVGGSPCQGFSMAGLKMGLEDERSKLFLDYVRILEETKPKWFLLENVPMSQEHKDVISKMLGVCPVMINSNLVSAQNRKRLYWTNIPLHLPLIDKGIYWGDVREHCVKDALYYTDEKILKLTYAAKRAKRKFKIIRDGDKIPTITASYASGPSGMRAFGIPDNNGLRWVTPIECERLQTLPDNYTGIVSKTQRYKMLGNGFTVDVIGYILSNIKTF